MANIVARTGQVILASDTVYPGKPLSDAEAFFAMVSKILVSIISFLLIWTLDHTVAFPIPHVLSLVLTAFRDTYPVPLEQLVFFPATLTACFRRASFNGMQGPTWANTLVEHQLEIRERLHSICTHFRFIFQDPLEGVLLMAYTPRQPSIGTENMLRCAYRAGLSGNMLLDDSGDGWNMGSGPDRELQGVPRTFSDDSEVYGRQDDTEQVRDPTHDIEERQAVNQCRTIFHIGAPTKFLRRNVVTSSKGCRPVLLYFRLSPGAMGRRNTMSTGTNSDDSRGRKASTPSSGRTLLSPSESAWLSEWESVFPDLRYRKCAIRDMASGPVKVLARRWGGGNTGDDAVTHEYLWGHPHVESCLPAKTNEV